MNIAEVKYNTKRNKLAIKPSSTSNPFKSDAETDYEKKKAAEKKAMMDEIDRVTRINASINV